MWPNTSLKVPNLNEEKFNFKAKLVDPRLKKECGLRFISLKRNDNSLEGEL